MLACPAGGDRWVRCWLRDSGQKRNLSYLRTLELHALKFCLSLSAGHLQGLVRIQSSSPTAVACVTHQGRIKRLVVTLEFSDSLLGGASCSCSLCGLHFKHGKLADSLPQPSSSGPRRVGLASGSLLPDMPAVWHPRSV